MEYEYDNDFKVKYIKYFSLFLFLAFITMLTIAILTNDSSEYTSITRETEVFGQIHNLEREHGTLYFEINTLKYKVRASNANNFKYKPQNLFNFLSGADWIEKIKGSDTLKIRRPITAKRSEYFMFVLGEDLNKDLKIQTTN